MKVGDLVKNKASGKLYVVNGVGDKALNIWITLTPVGDYGPREEVVYLSQYFELVSEAGKEIEKG
jgi:hypothetical protein